MERMNYIFPAFFIISGLIGFGSSFFTAIDFNYHRSSVISPTSSSLDINPTFTGQYNHVHKFVSMSSSPLDERKSFFYSKKSFTDIGLSTAMYGVINNLRLEKPSKIQAISFSSIYYGKHAIVADQTGSGKTLAYLLPTLQRVLELIRNGTVPAVPSRAPYIVIITPTTELALQVAKVAKSLAHILKFRSACVTSISDMDSEQRKLRLGVELLVSTPGRLLALLQRKELSLSQVHTVVLDEADVLFSDQSFPLQPIGAACPYSSQFIFTTATLPETITKQIMSEFPTTALLSGPGLHRIAATVEEVLVDCSGDSRVQLSQEEAFNNKRLALLRAIESGGNQESVGKGKELDRTIVFCNTIEQCRRVENALQRADRGENIRKVLAYHGALEGDAREQNIAEFSRPLLRQPVVLVCTDRASRGMDFDRSPVDHVILFDFPVDPSEYVRRVGRTGRAGRTGIATILVQGRQVPIAKQVVGASIQGKRIEPIAVNLEEK